MLTARGQQHRDTSARRARGALYPLADGGSDDPRNGLMPLSVGGYARHHVASTDAAKFHSVFAFGAGFREVGAGAGVELRGVAFLT
jgi:hypothetical protein